MKWVKTAIAIILFLVVMFFAYQSFESSFNPRRGHETESGKHEMTPAMVQMMQRMNQKKREDAGKKAPAESPDKKTGHPASSHTSSHKGTASEQTKKNGGE